MEKMYTKTFRYKGQMINYFNKLKKNPNVTCFAGFFCDCGSYAIHYWYTKA